MQTIDIFLLDWMNPDWFMNKSWMLHACKTVASCLLHGSIISVANRSNQFIDYIALLSLSSSTFCLLTFYPNNLSLNCFQQEIKWKSCFWQFSKKLWRLKLSFMSFFLSLCQLSILTNYLKMTTHSSNAFVVYYIQLIHLDFFS